MRDGQSSGGSGRMSKDPVEKQPANRGGALKNEHREWAVAAQALCWTIPSFFCPRSECNESGVDESMMSPIFKVKRSRDRFPVQDVLYFHGPA